MPEYSINKLYSNQLLSDAVTKEIIIRLLLKLTPVQRIEGGGQTKHGGGGGGTTATDPGPVPQNTQSAL